MTKTISLASIAKELKMSPKVARARARRGILSKRKAPWVFPATAKRAVITALKKED